jgi:uncharacterized Zn finger protein
MAGVIEMGVQCPVCRQKTAHTDLETKTNEQTWNCDLCGFYSETRIIEREGKQFWQVTQELPMSPEGRVAWPKDGTWTKKEFGSLPSFKGCPTASR